MASDYPGQDQLSDHLLSAAHLLWGIEGEYLVKRAARGDGDHVAEFRDLAGPLVLPGKGDVAGGVEPQPVGEEWVRLLDTVLPRLAQVRDTDLSSKEVLKVVKKIIKRRTKVQCM